MKRTLLTFLGILIGLYIILTLLDGKSEYVAEQMIWKANHKLAQVQKNPEAVPDSVYKQIAAQYTTVMTQFPHTRIGPKAAILLGNVYLVKKDYPTARQRFDDVFTKFSNNKEACAEAAMGIGKSYEAENKWSEAVKYYERTITDYPTTDIGLMMPVYVASYYRAQKDKDSAQIATDRAIRFYKNILSENPEAGIEFKTLHLLSNFYISLERWADAVETMGKVLMKYPTRQTAATTVTAINQISLLYLSDSNLAVNVYKEFIKTHPKHPLNETLKKMIASFQIIKEKNITLKIQDKK